MSSAAPEASKAMICRTSAPMRPSRYRRSSSPARKASVGGTVSSTRASCRASSWESTIRSRGWTLVAPVKMDRRPA